MKHILFIALFVTALQGFAQQQLNNVILKSKMEVTSDGMPGGDGGGATFTMAGNETTIKTYIRDSMRKVVTENNFMNNIVIYDGNKGITTTLTESMGEKTGFTQTREEIADQRRRMDSIAKAREAEGTPGGGMVIRMGGGGSNVTGIQYLEETKEINKINCKKALVTIKKNDGTEQKVEVWYSPDYKMPGSSGGRGMLNLAGLNGLPVMYETTNTINIGGNEMTMTSHYEVTGIEMNAQIADKEFEIPKGYKIKTYQEYIKDNPDGAPGMRRTFRMGGG